MLTHFSLCSGMDRLICLGNTVVPDQFFPVFKTIAAFENSIL